MSPELHNLRKALRQKANPQKAEILQSFFKTGPGQYGENDIFLGVVVPEIRKLVKTFIALPLADVPPLLQSHLHEERLLGFLLLVAKYKKATLQEKSRIYILYVKNLQYVNNWDLVDLTAEHIIGEHLYNRSKAPLYHWVLSKNLWKRRIAMLACFNYIKKREYSDALQIADKLLRDQEDLIHKAVGWMLREIGKKDLPVEEAFLKPRYRKMPRTMLRYAIERFPEKKRKAYLKGKF